MDTRPAAATTRGAAAAAATGSAALLLPPQEASVDTLSEEQQRDDATAPSEATAASDRAEEGDGDRRDEDEDKMALAMATAAAAEELAAAESHSLTQGAMKLVYLLAIQVCLWAVGTGASRGEAVSSALRRGARGFVGQAMPLCRCCSGCPRCLPQLTNKLIGRWGAVSAELAQFFILLWLRFEGLKGVGKHRRRYPCTSYNTASFHAGCTCSLWCLPCTNKNSGGAPGGSGGDLR